MDNWRILNRPTTDIILMPNFSHGLYYIDLHDTPKEGVEAIVDKKMLSDKMERAKHFKLLA
jgi:hypothetical protein